MSLVDETCRLSSGGPLIILFSTSYLFTLTFPIFLLADHDHAVPAIIYLITHNPCPALQITTSF